MRDTALVPHPTRVRVVCRAVPPALKHAAAVKRRLAQPHIHQVVQPTGPSGEVCCAADLWGVLEQLLLQVAAALLDSSSSGQQGCSGC